MAVIPPNARAGLSSGDSAPAIDRGPGSGESSSGAPSASVDRTFQDTAQVAGQTLQLNGASKRVRIIVDVYAMGLYVPKVDSSASALIPGAGPRSARIVLMRDLTGADFAEAMAGDPGRMESRREHLMALAGNPEILLLDEPTANIDVRAEEDIFVLLKEYNEKMTIVVVSHDIAFISAYVSRVACLNRTLVFHGSPEDAFRSGAIAQMYRAESWMVTHRH